MEPRLFNNNILILTRFASHWSKSHRYKKVYRGRFLLRDTPLLKKNRQLYNLPIRRYKLYQQLFNYGYRASEATSFFMQSEAKPFLTAAATNAFSYNYIFADISRFRT